MKKTALAALCVIALGACSKKDDLTMDNVAAGMNVYLAKRGDLCLAKNAWPIDVTQREMDAGARNALQMPVLEKIGLVTSSIADVEMKNEDQKAIVKVKRYQLTDEGKKYYLNKEIRSHTSDGGVKTNQGDFCAAHLSLDKVVGWEGPHSENGRQAIVVTYTYKVDAAPWTQNPEVQKVFPMVAYVVRGAGTAQLKEGFMLTREGWVAQDL